MAVARYPPHAFVSMGLIALNLAAFVVLLGGAASLQSDGAEIVALLNQVNMQPGNAVAYGDLKPVSTQGNFISYEWFKAVFQVLTLLIALAALAMGHLYTSRVALVGLFAALGVLFCDSTNTFYYLYLETHKNALVPKKVKREIETWFSGCIITSTLNFLLVISLGIGHGVPDHSTGVANTAPTGPKDTNGAATV